MRDHGDGISARKRGTLLAVVLLAASLSVGEGAVARAGESRTIKVEVRTACASQGTCDPDDNVLSPHLRGRPHKLLWTDRSTTFYRLERALYDSLPDDLRTRLRVLSDVIETPGYTWDTYEEELVTPAGLEARPEGDAWYLVQFYGSSELSGALGQTQRPAAKPFPAANHLVWTTPAERTVADRAVFSPDLDSGEEARPPPFTVQWAGPLHPFLKVDRSLAVVSQEASPVEVWMMRTAATQALLERIALLASVPDGDLDVRQQADLVVVRTRLRGADVDEVAREPLVFWVRRPPLVTFRDPSEPCSWDRRRDYDEVQGDESLFLRRPGQLEWYTPRAQGRIDTRLLDSLSPRLRAQLRFPPQGLLLASAKGCNARVDPRAFPRPSGVAVAEREDQRSLVGVLPLASPPPAAWAERLDLAPGVRVDPPVGGPAGLRWTSKEELAELQAMVAPDAVFFQPYADDAPWILSAAEVLAPDWKVDPMLAGPGRLARRSAVRVFRNPLLPRTRAVLGRWAIGEVTTRPELDTVTWVGALRVAGIEELARQPDVFAVESAGRDDWQVAHTDTVKVLAPPGLLHAAAAGVQQLPTGDPERSLYRLSGAVLDSMPPRDRSSLQAVTDDINFRWVFWVRLFDAPSHVLPGFEATLTGRDLWLLQLVGPPSPAWSEILVERGATLVDELGGSTYVAWIDEENVDSVRQLLAPEPFAEALQADPPRFLQAVEPLHPMFKVPRWVVSGGESFDTGHLVVLLADDGDDNRATRDFLHATYGDPEQDLESATWPRRHLDWLLAPDRPTGAELIEIARRSDVLFVGDVPPQYFAGAGGDRR